VKSVRAQAIALRTVRYISDLNFNPRNVPRQLEQSNPEYHSQISLVVSRTIGTFKMNWRFLRDDSEVAVGRVSELLQPLYFCKHCFFHSSVSEAETRKVRQD